MEDNLTTQLSEIEKAELETLEGIIERSVKSFVAVGRALMAIRDNRLYREEFKTFKEYCRDKWGMTRQYSYNLITSSQVVVNLSTAVDLCTPCEIQPTCEYQVRPLAPLEPEQQREVWEEAVKKAVKTTPEGKVQYRHVKEAVTEFLGPAPPPPKPQTPPPLSNAVHIVLTAISHLEGILDDDPRREEAFQMLLSWIDKNRKRRTR